MRPTALEAPELVVGVDSQPLASSTKTSRARGTRLLTSRLRIEGLVLPLRGRVSAWAWRAGGIETVMVLGSTLFSGDGRSDTASGDRVGSSSERRAPLGQTSTQAPHSSHRERSKFTLSTTKDRAPFGQARTHDPHPVHNALSILGIVIPLTLGVFPRCGLICDSPRAHTRLFDSSRPRSTAACHSAPHAHNTYGQGWSSRDVCDRPKASCVSPDHILDRR